MNIWVRLWNKINNYLKYNSRKVPLAWGCVFFILVAFIDYEIAPEISLAIFYLLPIALITWFLGKEAGFLACGLSAIAERLVRKNLNSSGELNSLAFYWNSLVIFLLFLSISYLFYKLHCSLEREKELARIDDKTGLANKRLFIELAGLEVKKAIRFRHPLTIIYMDVDDFKHINETLGYCVGDKLLQTVAETIKRSLRETDIIARMGGDEFIILLPGSGYESSQAVICRVQKKLLETMQDNQWKATFSIGAVTFINPPKSVEDMIHRADRLMYTVKTNGKNQLKHKTSV